MRVEYGNLPVPQPVMWSEEEEFWVGICPYFKLPAICQKEAQGQGVPRFGRPHAMRLRKLMFLGLCDICGKPLKNSTKVSLSHAPAAAKANVQVEPLMHVECAKLSIQHCPALREQTKDNVVYRLTVRQVFRYRTKPLLAQPEDLARYVPDHIGPPLIGLAALELLSWKDITAETLIR